ncbi:MAG: VWA domain-containing protein [Negativicutes bacterium]|nr:VWA domain-containing protein [Negativicutes bacterium]
MNEGLHDQMKDLLPLLSRQAEELAGHIRRYGGARIGESTVVSKKMHTFVPSTPEEVTIILNSDAGQIFYQRSDPGEVFHLDIFHQCGLVDHRQVASAVKKAVEVFNYHVALSSLTIPPDIVDLVKADLIDVQTATGGGRLTGSLNFGRKPSLRRAHENHVHIAAMLPEERVACLFMVVMAVEGVITAHSLEIRRNERLTCRRGAENSPADLSAYSDHSDSFLKGRGGKALPPEAKQQQYTQDAAELADLFETVEEMREFLSRVEQEGGKQKTFAAGNSFDETIIGRLSLQGIVKTDAKKVTLTDYGKEFKVYLERHLPEVEAMLRRSLRMIKPAAGRPGRFKSLSRASGGASGKKMLVPESFNGSLQELAVAETVNAAARRTVAENRISINIEADDLRYWTRKKQSKAAICLLLDASASMAGPRLRAAKFLVRHLLLSTPDQISLVLFQQEAANVHMPFTRDYQLAQESLRRITAFGSTPLALGLRTCSTYLAGAGVKNPLIILITDGVPTIGDRSRDPLADALAAAQEIKEQKWGFTCLGLKPYRNYLVQLAEEAGGTVCVLEELEKSALVEQTWRERAVRHY